MIDVVVGSLLVTIVEVEDGLGLGANQDRGF